MAPSVAVLLSFDVAADLRTGCAIIIPVSILKACRLLCLGLRVRLAGTKGDLLCVFVGGSFIGAGSGVGLAVVCGLGVGVVVVCGVDLGFLALLNISSNIVPLLSLASLPPPRVRFFGAGSTEKSPHFLP